MDFFYSLKSGLLIAAKIALNLVIIAFVATIVVVIANFVQSLSALSGPLATILQTLAAVPAAIQHYMGSVFFGVLVAMLGVIAFALATWVFVKVLPALKVAVHFLTS